MDRQTTLVQPRAAAATTDIIISYPGRQFSRAKSEVLQVLREFGDPTPAVLKTSVWGIAVAITALDNREVIRRCHARWQQDPAQHFRFAVKWVPVEYWTESRLTELRALIEQHIAPRIGADDTWAMRVQKRRWERYHTAEIVTELAKAVPRKVDLNHPDWILWVDVIGRNTAVSLLRPEDIFSAAQPLRPM